MKGLINIKKISVFILLLFLSACYTQTTDENILENVKKAEIITMDAETKSLKGRINISADGNLIGFKTNSFNENFKQIEYTVFSYDKKELFRILAANPDGISDKSFDMYEIYENENILGYIQSDVFRGNESYIVYNEHGEKYAFCYTGENKNDKTNYKIISFEDELLYTLNISNPFENKFDMSLKRMRPDSENDISALALAFIINTDCNNEYFKVQEELKNNKAK